MSQPFDPTDRLCVNAIRSLALDMIESARSGHPGLPLGAAPMAYVLWSRHLRIDPTEPRWPDRDRFVLSAGHGSALLYALLHLTGYDLAVEDLRDFRQWGSRTPGHPAPPPVHDSARDRGRRPASTSRCWGWGGSRDQHELALDVCRSCDRSRESKPMPGQVHFQYRSA